MNIMRIKSSFFQLLQWCSWRHECEDMWTAYIVPDRFDSWEDRCILGIEMRWQSLTDSAYAEEVMGILGNI
jgi:hypothetical protein